MQGQKPKIAIVGCGNVGSTFAFSLSMNGAAREIAIIDKDSKRASGEAMDLNHGASFFKPINIYNAGYDGCKDADIIVITAGAKQKPGETRMDLAQKNTEIFKEIIPQISRYAKDAILLIVTNPVDILTYVTLKISNFPKNRVLGSGTVLDSSRFRFLIGKHCNVDPRNVHAYIIGEHGDTELPVLSHANIGGMVLAEYCPLCNGDCNYKIGLNNIFEDVKTAAYKIIEAKGATYYAIALALMRIVEAILRDENSVLPVSTLINGYYGIDDVCLSIPSIINKKGVERVLAIELSEDELKKLKHSAGTLKDIIKEIRF